MLSFFVLYWNVILIGCQMEFWVKFPTMAKNSLYVSFISVLEATEHSQLWTSGIDFSAWVTWRNVNLKRRKQESVQSNSIKTLLRKMAQAITFLARISEVPCSNLDRDIDYPDWGPSWLSSVPPEKFYGCTLNHIDWGW